MNNEVKFEELNSSEQKNKLKQVMEQVKLLQRAEIISGEIEISDIAFFRLPSGEVAYDVYVCHPDGNVGHMYYQESDNMLSKIDLENTNNKSTDISTQYDTTKESSNSLAVINQGLVPTDELTQSLETSSRIALSTLDIAEQLGIDIKDVEYLISITGDSNLNLSEIKPEQIEIIKQTAELTGISEPEILENIKIDANESVSIDEKAFDMSGLQSSAIEGNEKVTTNFTFNQIIGLNYDSYKIIITKSGVPVIVGISQDGSAELIPEGRVEVDQSENNAMSLLRDDGTIKNVGVLLTFRIKDAASSLGRDQAIGLYNDNGTVNSFYARNYLGDRMIGEELPSTVQTPQRIHNEHIMDTQRNADIESEADSATARVSDDCNAKVTDLGNGQSNNMYGQKDAEEILQETANYYNIEYDELHEKYDEKVHEDHSQGSSDSELIEESAQEILEEDEEDNHEPNREERHSPFEPWH